MVGLWLGVYCLTSYAPKVTKVQVSSYARGVGGVLGNKGAVYCRMEILDTSVCFVCSHFTPHREKVLQRNKDFHAILHQKVFPDIFLMKLNSSNSLHAKRTLPTKYVALEKKIHDLKKRIRKCQEENDIFVANGEDVDPLSSTATATETISSVKSTPTTHTKAIVPPCTSQSQPSSVPGQGPAGPAGPGQSHEPNVIKEMNVLSANDHDVIVWLGDLNYRIVSEMEMASVYEHIYRNRIHSLVKGDQLIREMESNQVFNGFFEGLLNFPPTYQYIPGAIGF